MSFREKNKNFITILFVVSLILFLYLIRNFLVVLALALIFAGMLTPVNEKLAQKLKGKFKVSAAIITALFLLMFIIPSIFFFVEIINQANEITSKVIPMIGNQLEAAPAVAKDTTAQVQHLPDWVPMSDELDPYREQIVAKFQELIERLGGLIIKGIGTVTTGTVNFFINLFIMLFAMYFYLTEGKNMLSKASYYLPLTEKEFNTIVTDTMDISKATVKGAVVIGIIQGSLVGLSLWVAGVPGSLFWGAIAAVASLIPSVGCALVYVPAGIYLIISGNTPGGVGVLLWGFLVVGTVDNILRPYLVGRDAQISELTILLSTLGGIGMFGISGVILGPVIASFFTTMAKMYRESA